MEKEVDAKLKLATHFDQEFIKATQPDLIKANGFLQFLGKFQRTFTGHSFDIINVEQRLSSNHFDNRHIDENANVLTAFEMRVEDVHESRRSAFG